MTPKKIVSEINKLLSKLPKGLVNDSDKGRQFWPDRMEFFDWQER